MEGPVLSRSRVSKTWPAARSRSAFGAVASSIVVSLALGACRGEPDAAAASSIASADSSIAGSADGSARPQRMTAAESHQRMIAALREVRQRTYQENLWQGEGAADVARNRLARLPADGDPVERWKLLLDAGHQPSGPLRGYKTDVYEGGHRVPMLARWPGRIAANSQCDATICHTHLPATCADLLGVKLPDDAGEDSASILPRWRAGTQVDRNRIAPGKNPASAMPSRKRRPTSCG